MPTEVSVIETTVHKTHAWIDQVAEEAGWRDKHAAYLGLRVVLHRLRDRLPVGEAADLGAQLPMLVRGLYYEGWKPASVPVKDRNIDQFLEGVAEDFPTAPGEPGVDAETITRAVFKVLSENISEGEINDVKAVLPEALLGLWAAWP